MVTIADNAVAIRSRMLALEPNIGIQGPTTKRVTKIRIKLGPGLLKRGSTEREKQVAQDRLRARRNKTLLGAYPGPSASDDAIVQALRDEGPALEMYKSWEGSKMGKQSLRAAALHSASLQLSLSVQLKGARTQKRPPPLEQPSSAASWIGMEASNAAKQDTDPCLLSGPPAILVSTAVAEAVPGSIGKKRKVSQALDALKASGELLQSAPACVEDPQQDHQQDQRPGSSNSDHATNTGFRLPSCSPDQGVPSCSLEHGHDFPSCSVRETPDVKVENEQYVALQRPSIGCQAGPGVILPQSCMAPPTFSATAVSMRSISPLQLRVPARHLRQTADQIDDAFVNSIIRRARDMKHAADRERGGQTAPWTVKALCKQVESAVLFMEACEYILRGARMADRTTRLASLYGSTATLLSYTTSAAEAAKGPDLGKEALRILSDRLCAVCHMREASHSQGRIADAASKALQLSSKCSQPQLPAQPSMSAQPGLKGGSDAGCGRGSQPSPDDSTTSSQDVVVATSGPARHRVPIGHATASGAAAAALPGCENLQRILEQARQVARFSTLIRRSTIGYQAFMERPDYLNSEPAKIASMHIAVVSLDLGMADGFSMLSHAVKACACIVSMCQ